MPIDLVIDEREGGTKMEGLPGETNSNPDLRIILTSSFNLSLGLFSFNFQVATMIHTLKAVKINKADSKKGFKIAFLCKYFYFFFVCSDDVKS